MPKFAHADFLRGGLDYLKANATKMILIKAYAFGDSYATVLGNKLAEVTVATGDYTLSASGNNQQLALPTGKSGPATASSVSGDDLHIAFTDGSAKVLYVTDETGDQVVTSGNTVNFPSLTYTSNQPT